MSKYDNAVSLTRIVAMVFIVVCHCAAMFGLNAVASLFDVGVPIFFVISGYLTASKQIDNRANWIKKKLLRLYVPLGLWVFVYVLVKIIRGESIFSFQQGVLLLMNMQGLNHVYKGVPLGIGPWFFTVIEICYLFYLVLDAIRLKTIQKYSNFTFVSLFLIVTILQLIGLNFGGVFAFYIGCFLCNRKDLMRKLSRSLGLILIIGIVSVGARLGGKYFFDNTILYDNVLSSITHSMLALSVFLFFKWCDYHWNKTVSVITSCSLIRWLDKISVYVYLTHTWFLGTLICNVFTIGSIPVGIVCLIILTLAMSSLLYYGNTIINKLIKL